MFQPPFHSRWAISLLTGIAILLALAACSRSVTPTPELPLGPGPTWTPEEAISRIEALPFTTDSLAWNASFDRRHGRWEVTLVRRVRVLYPAREERRTWVWYVHEDTGEVEGPFKQDS